MTSVFVDASAWIALLVRDDKDHARARSWFLRLPTNVVLITTDHVIAEAATWFKYHHLHSVAIELRNMARAARQTGLLEIQWIDDTLMDEAWSIFAQYDDQLFSFFDCTSFAACNQARVDSVFAFDTDFRTMGFDVRP